MTPHTRNLPRAASLDSRGSLRRLDKLPQTSLGATTLKLGVEFLMSKRVQFRMSIDTHLSEPYLTGSRPAFSATLTTTALDRRSLRWFGACS